MSMDPQQPKFFQADFQLEYREMSLGLNGLVSSSGITKVFIPKMMSDILKAVVGEVVRLKISGKEADATLTQQLVAHGAFYELRFRNPPEELSRYIESRAKTDGVAPGWQRKFPRIPVKAGSDDGLPRPNLCMVRFAGREFFMNICDFTLGGLRLETKSEYVTSLRASSVLVFDLVTTTGELIANLSGEVRYIAIQEQKAEVGKSPMRALGIKFTKMDPVNERKYKNLIQDYCVALQKRISGEK